VFHKLKSFLAILLIASAFGSWPAFALQDEESSWESHSDFVIRLKAHVLPHYLKYKTSTLDPVTAVDITYKKRDQHRPQEFTPLKRYEDLWFHDRHSIGVLRSEHLELERGQHGIVMIEDTPDLASQTGPVSMALIRILMDVHLLDANVTAVVPDHIYHQLTPDLAALHFHETHMLSSSQRGILFHLVSTDRKFDNYYWFDVR
jgi:hypothetical protein